MFCTCTLGHILSTTVLGGVERMHVNVFLSQTRFTHTRPDAKTAKARYTTCNNAHFGFTTTHGKRACTSRARAGAQSIEIRLCVRVRRPDTNRKLFART